MGNIKPDKFDSNNFHDPFEFMQFSDEFCFLCGASIDETKSKEHVFPKWLLGKFDLWNQKITLLNGTLIPYRQLKVPCCRPCNVEYLSRIERKVEAGYSKGFRAFKKIDEIVLYQWVGKIFYGLLFRELSLAVDRTDPDLDTITNPEFLKDYRTLHLFLQSARRATTFFEFTPGSIFVFETETLGNGWDFDYSDNFQAMTFCIRMGNIGLIACLKDDGVIKEVFSESLQRFDGLKLHPIQFDEVCAVVFYKAMLLNRTGKYVIVTPGDENEQERTVVKVPGFSLAPIFDPWDNRTFARFLEQFWMKWGISFDDIFQEPDSVRTYLG